MANIMDYMDWRGDLSFEADEFNEVDNLILAQLAYVDFEGIVTAEENAPAVPLKEASGQFWEKNDKDEILARVSMTKSAPFVMEKMAETKRFSDVKLRCYVNEIRDEEQFQFSAVCVELPDDSLYVAFRGTDNTITGWREDFNMGYLSETPGQLRAVEYLNRAVTDKKQRVRVGGHSKGGNFAGQIADAALDGCVRGDGIIVIRRGQADGSTGAVGKVEQDIRGASVVIKSQIILDMLCIQEKI